MSKDVAVRKPAEVRPRTIPGYTDPGPVSADFKNADNAPHTDHHDALAAAAAAIAAAVPLNLSALGDVNLTSMPSGSQIGLVFNTGTSKWVAAIVVGEQGVQGDPGADGATGSAGPSFNFRGDWAASTTYAPYDVVRGVSGTPQFGGVYLTLTSFTSTSTFNAANWNVLVPPFAGATDLRVPTDTSSNDATTWVTMFPAGAPIGANERHRVTVNIIYDALGAGTTAGIMFRFTVPSGCAGYGSFRALNPTATNVNSGHQTIAVYDIANQTFGTAGLHGVTATGSQVDVDLAVATFEITLENGSTAGTWNMQHKQITLNAGNPSLVKGPHTQGSAVRIA